MKVFGLGNKTYDHYNSMGTYTDNRLAELGATRIFDLGLGDDDGKCVDDPVDWMFITVKLYKLSSLKLNSKLSCSLEEDFISWKEQFWQAVCEFFGVQATQEECRYSCLFVAFIHFIHTQSRQIQKVPPLFFCICAAFWSDSLPAFADVTRKHMLST